MMKGNNMKTGDRNLKWNQLVLGITVALLMHSVAQAIPDLRIAIQGSDVVLTWPSQMGAEYIVQYRPTLLPENSWATLASNHPASAGQFTSFTHVGIFTCPPMAPGGGSGGGGPPPVPGGAQSMTSDGGQIPLWDRWLYEGRDLYPWEAEQRPPYPWEAAYWQLAYGLDDGKRLTVASGADAGAASSLSDPSCVGFYRVVRRGVHLYGITNNVVVSGILQLPIEIGVDFIAEPMGVYFAPLNEGEEDRYPNGARGYDLDESNRTPVLEWDTHQATNGTYTLKLALYMAGSTVIIGDPVTVIVSNRIQMPRVPRVIVSGLPIYAIIDQPNAAYTITIRNQAGAVVRTLTGNAVNGIINRHWDGLDEDGNNALVNGEHVEYEISYNPSYKNKAWVWYDDAFLNGEWLIAYQRLYSGVNQASMDNAMQQVSIYCEENGGLALAPYVRIEPGAGDWSSARTTLAQPNTRNFYYWGHGGPDKLGFASNDQFNGIRARQLGSLLGNVLVTNVYQVQHAFRFVFLDGCQTGTKASIWPETFGIEPYQDTLEYFAFTGGAPRAFCGWKKVINTAVFDTSRFTFAQNFFEFWINDRDNLQAALLRAMTGTIGSGELADLQIWGYPILDAQ